MQDNFILLKYIQVEYDIHVFCTGSLATIFKLCIYTLYLPANPQKKSPKSYPLKLGPPYSRSINVTESKETRGKM